ncbi:hypothetical protein CK203_060700 [Vitis vinifera]|uniref:Uncharacterized protein n=1 Tax=Vitis vinifera TaxID=29760 RepID=A0A438GCD7_VITVI|nr:hypothetical protein CK203_060700 [Vitis vinifera]
MGAHHTHLVNEDDDDEDAEDEDVYMYLAYMHPDEWDAYRCIVRASKASDWEREQHENIVGSKRIPGVFYWYTADDAKIIVLYFFEMQKEDSVIERQLQQGQPWCPVSLYRKKLNIIIAENDQVTEKDYLDLLDISTEVGEEEDNQLFQWVRSIHLDDKVGNPDPRIAAHAREFGVNVERVLSEEVHSESFNKDIDDSLQAALNSHQEIDSTSVGHSSRPSAAGTSALVTMVQEVELMMEDEDHGSRRANLGIGAIRKPYRGRERMMKPYNEELLSGSFESMSIGTQFSDSSNEANVYPPHVMSYGQPSSSTYEEYGMSRYSPSRQMPYQVPYQMEGGFGINTWVNFEYPIHVEAVGRTQEIYAWHVRIFNQYNRGSLSWYQYCLQQQVGVPSSINPIEPH